MITSTLLALAVAALGLVGVPAALALGTWWTHRPRLALACWSASLLLGVVAALAAVATWMLPVPVWDRPGCSGCVAAGAVVVGVGSLLAVLAAVVLVAVDVERLVRAQQRARLDLLLLSGTAAHSQVRLDGVRVVLVDHDEAFAFSSRAAGRRIVVSSALASLLADDELASVVEHELAHLRGQHDRIVQLAGVVVSCFPWLRAARGFETRLRLMVELIADDRAARASGAQVTARALGKLALATGDDSPALRADRLRPVVEPAPLHLVA